jgi:hypothetical protein
MYVTVEQLRERDACLLSVEAFLRLFPTGRARVTRKNLVRYAKATNSFSDIMWVVQMKIIHLNYGEFTRRTDHTFEEVCLKTEGRCECAHNIAEIVADMLKLK